ncbi:TrkH family potassium uptake protein [Ancylobacter mangrovi]|uniref:Trk system potassium uptake protein n=1 Tax=Ancylobacter mangrovi TaxID=2972472 RepID=A0A9X2PG80_9HYPH|nr:TrkH family potassium uptake protein [Ancylobacter mangrovi]MCS0495435.1 TrkH family potassium uptake protein [Ancylobacter mangrovi]MCS0503082.1 TrkH family potassium uptake protein [Ancylobacter mangrovi]
MIDLRPIAAILGVLLTILGTTMMIPALVDVVTGEGDYVVYAAAAVITAFVGLSLWLAGRTSEVEKLDLRQAFVLTTASWGLLSAFAAIPFMWANTALSFTDAYFEAMSGLTTTGATVISGLDHRPAGILIWRAFLHWYGGVGIIVLAMALLPMLRIGGMQLFRAESSDKSEKVLPRAAQLAKGIVGTYVLLTVACAFTYAICGMSVFDAVAHAMATISTGGFSTHDASIGYFHSPAIEYAAIFFMLSGSLPFVLYVRVLAGDFSRLVANTEVRLFLSLVVLFALISFVEQVRGNIAHGEEAMRHALFNVVTLMSTTGFVAVDYTNWGPPTDALYFIVMFLGACTGSTAGGMKSFRIAILGSALGQHLRRIIYPNGVFPVRYGGKPIGDDVVASVLSFAFLYLATFLVIGIVVNALGFDLITSFSASITALANVGPGLGPVVGPSQNFASLPDHVIWLLSFAMLLGRLELFTVLVLFLPSFWRR